MLQTSSRSVQLVFTCKNWRRYSRERASQSLEVIQLICSFASLTQNLDGLRCAEMLDRQAKEKESLTLARIVSSLLSRSFPKKYLVHRSLAHSLTHTFTLSISFCIHTQITYLHKYVHTYIHTYITYITYITCSTSIAYFSIYIHYMYYTLHIIHILQ